jgi:dGTPase
MKLTRELLEKLEEKNLANYATKSKESRGRIYPEKEHPYRTCFQRDRDRIIHSTAFRRLEYKTQVFVIHEGDYYRTRLTHTLEVSQIARSIGMVLGLNLDLIEAIALGHDMGHTPFGHSGEESLKRLLKDYGGFEHNLQGLRVVDWLEKRYPDFPGLNLSWEVREGLLKHSTGFDIGFKKGEEFVMPAEYAGKSLKDFYSEKNPSLEAQVVDVADEIAYDNHDLDDGITSGLLNEGDLEKVDIWKEALIQVKKKYTNLSSNIKKCQVIRTLINMKVSDAVIQSELNLKDINSKDGIKNAPKRLISFSEEMQEKRAPLRKFLYQKLYHHYRVVRMADKARRIIEELFRVYINKPEQLPVACQENIKAEGLYRAICDYIASMTDRFALEEYKKLFDPLTKV